VADTSTPSAPNIATFSAMKSGKLTLTENEAYFDDKNRGAIERTHQELIKRQTIFLTHIAAGLPPEAYQIIMDEGTNFSRYGLGQR